MVEIRNVKIEDAQQILEIYDYYVRNTAITFEYETPTVAEFKQRMINTMKKYPYLVILKNDVIVGYAYAGAFVGRKAYDWSCEMTVYIEKNVRKCGLGRKIYEALEKELYKMGIVNLYACVGCPDEDDEFLTKNSIEFHDRMGYSIVGKFHKCGYKFDRWYNIVWMEKFIGEHKDKQSMIVSYPNLNKVN